MIFLTIKTQYMQIMIRKLKYTYWFFKQKGVSPPNAGHVTTSSSAGIPSLYSSLMYTKASAAAASYQASRNAAAAAAAAAAAGMQYPAPTGYPSLDQLAGLRRPVPVIY